MSPHKIWPAEQRTNPRTLEEVLDGIPSRTAELEGPVQIGELSQLNVSARPTLSDDARYGLAGDIVRKLIPETESHPAAMLIEVLMSYGSIIGRTAHYEVEDTEHYCNLFAVKVGISSKSRKGTASRRIKKIFSAVDPNWDEFRKLSSLSSGEGLIHQIRDERIVNNLPVEDGVADKRLFVYLGEFASQLAVMKRDGNTLSSVVRNAWDGSQLEIPTKNSPSRCSKPHVSILGDITRDELLQCLTSSDRNNGFANRFLWIHVERCGSKPFGGEDIDWTDEIRRLINCVKYAICKSQRFFFDRNARLMWERAYEKLSEGRPGAVGSVTSRGEAQVVRLALIYALLDQADHIRVEHLKAALALWRYSEDSARIIFGEISPDQQSILNFLASGPRNRTEIYRDCFRNHRKAEAISMDLEHLQRIKRIKERDGQFSLLKQENGHV